MTESSWGYDQYVPRFDFGEPDYSDALCVKSPEQQFSAENYGLSGYKCGGQPPPWYIPPDSGFACKSPPSKCSPSTHRGVSGPPGGMASGIDGTRAGGWTRGPRLERLENPTAAETAASDELCVRINKQWLFIILFILIMTLSTSIGVCYKFMRKLSKHMKAMKKE